MKTRAVSRRKVKKNRFMGLIVAVVLTVLPCPVLFGMGSADERPPEEKRTASGAQKSAEQKATAVRNILQDPGAFVEAPVLLEGLFRGWSGTCAGSPPQTRSDWVFEDSSGCIYVTGMLPSVLSAAAPHGERIIVDAIVKIGKNRAPYLSARSIKVLPLQTPKE